MTLGLGEGTDWHPRHKRPVGQRLAWEALRVVYGRPAMSGMGPALDGLTREGGELVASFRAVGELAVDGDRLLGFELAGDNGVWRPAEARVSGGVVRLAHPAVPFPVEARYAWGDNPVATLRIPAASRRYPSPGAPRRKPVGRAPEPDPCHLHILSSRSSSSSGVVRASIRTEVTGTLFLMKYRRSGAVRSA